MASVSTWRQGWTLLRLPHTPLFCALMFLILGHADPIPVEGFSHPPQTSCFCARGTSSPSQYKSQASLVSYLNPPQKETHSHAQSQGQMHWDPFQIALHYNRLKRTWLFNGYHKGNGEPLQEPRERGTLLKLPGQEGAAFHSPDNGVITRLL